MKVSVGEAFAHCIAVQNIRMTYVSGRVSLQVAEVENVIS